MTGAQQNQRKSATMTSYRPTLNDSTLLDYDYLIKLVVVGDSGVGKSQLVARFTRNEFDKKSRQTIGVEFATKTITVEGKMICSQLWDTAGEERYRALASAYYRGAIGVLLVYDVTNPKSFVNLAHWLSEIKAYTLPSCQVVLVGNKIDLKKRRAVEESSVQTFAKKNGMRYIETSALEATNVQAAFTHLIKDIYIKTILKKKEGPKNLSAEDGLGSNSRKFQLSNHFSDCKKDSFYTKCCGTE